MSSARTDLCGRPSAMIVPTATLSPKGMVKFLNVEKFHAAIPGLFTVCCVPRLPTVPSTGRVKARQSNHCCGSRQLLSSPFVPVEFGRPNWPPEFKRSPPTIATSASLGNSLAKSLHIPQ